MRKGFYLFIIFCVFGLEIFAAPVTLEHAKQVASSFFQYHRGLKKVKRIIEAKPIEATTINAEGYLFVPSGGKGFVWVAGDDNLPQVLGYSFEGDIEGKFLPPQLKALMQAYGATNHPEEPELRNGIERNSIEPIAPLLATLRWQESPFNGMCPFYINEQGHISDQRCLVGCVATSLEQIMTYYKYPKELQDTLKGWQTPHYVLSDIMPGTAIDWNHILNDYSSVYTEQQVRAVQQLSYYCGMVCKMNYGLGASGANMSNVAPNMQKVFGYKTARYYEKSWYTATQWTEMLHHELKQKRPVLYAGHNVELSGHAFVLDGLDKDGLYHVNWGYIEDYNGYFNLDYLNPFENPKDPTDAGRYEGFFCNQSAVFLHPDAVSALPFDTINMNNKDVTVDSVRFSRHPDTAKYVPVDFYLTNHRKDTINYTFEIMTYLPSDTAIFRQAEYVGLTGETLLPGVQTCVKAYCKFGRTGNFLLGISDDDIHIPFAMPIKVIEAMAPMLSFHTPQILQLEHNQVTVIQRIQNLPLSGWAGNLVTYSLFCEEKKEDSRHWTFLNLSPGQEIQDTITYQFLEPNSAYTLKVRCPWNVVAEINFTTPQMLDIKDEEHAVHDPIIAIYTLNGVCATRNENNRIEKNWNPPYTGIFLIKKASGRIEKRMMYKVK